mmetsp:Transcript_19178/g.33022  ORF Transcript_19178/g.33022 Transcript_19178/m.33022 type:complete len:219 (+) Transcript_19178:305-961(+)
MNQYQVHKSPEQIHPRRLRHNWSLTSAPALDLCPCHSDYRGRGHNAAPAIWASCTGVDANWRRLMRMGRPLAVWMVAPVAMPTCSGVTASSKVKRRSSMERPTVASNRANWSPMHLRTPPPNGMKAKSDMTSLGYSAPGETSGRKPAHLPSNAGLLKGSEKRSGLKVSGSFHKCGEWCKFHTLMNRSAPLPMGYPAGSPLSPGGSVSSDRERRMRIGG